MTFTRHCAAPRRTAARRRFSRIVPGRSIDRFGIVRPSFSRDPSTAWIELARFLPRDPNDKEKSSGRDPRSARESSDRRCETRRFCVSVHGIFRVGLPRRIYGSLFLDVLGPLNSTRRVLLCSSAFVGKNAWESCTVCRIIVNGDMDFAIRRIWGIVDCERRVSTMGYNAEVKFLVFEG